MTQLFKAATVAGFLGAAVALAGAYGAVRFGWISFASGPAIHEYILAHPDILVEASNKLQAEQDANDASQETARQAAVDKLGTNVFFNPRVAFTTGPEHSKSTIVEFFDYNCPYCRASVPAVRKFMDTHKGTR